ncbi:MAG: hypothetical protein CLLPBCKN_006872 [Chroococcidiopsis cubana SAG 39.79]|uniref:Uncharacterized protein n=1 Tax=Chroococcidiopsis cubana SAG 39.79 TaxID=388085 RepID=A0AB37UIM6_9CYAN|nr:hypothetical protein [Chroococcidiopsis cubana]MDZ4877437.1 hypothetical protein [Chroococcidiopsis cubana SAG 39.79]PSB65839.1 hypothetical protein C7B79_03740 [Chroococcidiopsis cubana CCALA 043]RUT11226.1 hypothetical protein DSM107010_34950 [Chroococcidiopsis cubana SAG 39.79]
MYQQRRNSQSNSPQQQSANPFSFGPTTFPIARAHRAREHNTRNIERAEEFEVAQVVANMGIRRGNRRGSIIDTNFASCMQVEILTDCLNDIKQVFEDSLINAERENKINPAQKEEIRNIVGTDIAFSAYLTKLRRYGNCEEFVNVVFTHIMQKTIGKPVYKVKMVGNDEQENEFDHEFVITTSSEVGKVSNTEEFDPQGAVVIDSWHNNKVQSLGQFYAGDNPYGMVVGPNNISIMDSAISNGSGLYMTSQQEDNENRVRAYINDAVSHVWERWADIYEEELAQVRNGGIESIDGIFDFPRDNEVHDKRNDASFIDPRMLLLQPEE